MSEGDKIPHALYFPRAKKPSKYRNSPVTSYGIIAYTIKDGIPYYLLYQRRDSFEYMDFMRGTWTCESRLPALFASMTREERTRIRNYTFDELWDDLWVTHNSSIYYDGKEKARRKYDTIKTQIPKLIDTTHSYINEPPWGFPKGKKARMNESELECARREFEEETRISKDKLNIRRHRPYIENFFGSNSVCYCTHYYVAEMMDKITPTRMDTPECIRESTVSEEASNVEWFTFREALHRVHPRRKEMLRNIHKTLVHEN